MIARIEENMRRQLSRWGYPAYLLENMKPWSLIVCYNNEKAKRALPRISRSTMELLMTEEVEIVQPIKLKRTPKKYLGVRVAKKKTKE